MKKQWKQSKQHVFSSEEYQLIVKDLVNFLSSEELEEWAMLSWSIWKAHNSFIHENSRIHSMAVYQKSLDLLKDFQQLQDFQLPLSCVWILGFGFGFNRFEMP